MSGDGQAGACAGVEMRYALRRGSFDLDVDLRLSIRGITGLFGPSGSGKTTLLRCIAGLEQPSSGRLVVDGDVWQDHAEGISRAVHDRRIGYVFQEPRLFGHLDVRRNLDFGRRRARGADGGVDMDRIVALLGLERLLPRKPDALSGGEAQRVSIARALLRAPRFVLMDEPLASLDEPRKAEILPFLDRLHAESSVPIVYVSHSIAEICRLCDQLVVMDDGRVVADGDLQAVLTRTDVPMLTGDEAGSVIDATVAGHDAGFGLSRVAFSGGELWVSGRYAPGEAVRLRVRANDISLCRQRPSESTILNIVPAVIDAIHAEPGPSVLVRLLLGADTLTARITKRSQYDLNLQAGDRVLAQIKSVAVRSAPTG